MGNAQNKSLGTSSSIKRRKSSITSLTGAISKFHQKQSSAASQKDGQESNVGSTSGISRSASGTDINEKNYSQFIPTEKLAKVSNFFINSVWAPGVVIYNILLEQFSYYFCMYIIAYRYCNKRPSKNSVLMESSAKFLW